MDHEWMIMRTGAGRYIQGENTSSLVGQELKRLGFHKVGIIAGKRAFEAAKQPLITGLDQAGLVYDVSIYPGYCTAGDIDFYVHWARQQSYDCVHRVRGGKKMD